MNIKRALKEKMEEELSELADEVRQGSNISRIEDEFGDLLFTLVNLGRKLDLDAEICLMHTNRKFAERFRGLESIAERRSLNLPEMDLESLEELYQQAKAAIEQRKKG